MWSEARTTSRLPVRSPQGLAASGVDATRPCGSHIRGAPPIVASGSLSIVYLWLCKYITGTPGICRFTSRERREIMREPHYHKACRETSASTDRHCYKTTLLQDAKHCYKTSRRQALLQDDKRRCLVAMQCPKQLLTELLARTHLAQPPPQIFVACGHDVTPVLGNAIADAVIRVCARVAAW